MPALHAVIHIAVANLFNADKRINGIQIEDHEIKILEVNFGDSILNKSKWKKMSEGIAKISISGAE